MADLSVTDQVHRLRCVGWSEDFVRATRERPLWARLLLKVALGRYAYRELIGLQQAFYDAGWIYPHDLPEYELEGCNYHQEPQPWDFKKALKERNE